MKFIFLSSIFCPYNCCNIYINLSEWRRFYMRSTAADLERERERERNCLHFNHPLSSYVLAYPVLAFCTNFLQSFTQKRVCALVSMSAAKLYPLQWVHRWKPKHVHMFIPMRCEINVYECMNIEKKRFSAKQIKSIRVLNHCHKSIRKHTKT